MSTTSWWSELYDDAVADLLLQRKDPSALEQTLAFLHDKLALGDSGARVFDQCCGIGSLALPLAARGHEVVAIDQAARYIERARDAARAQALELTLEVADALAHRVGEPCDAAINWWTSFGYGPDDATNGRMLTGAFASLRPGGLFALDTMNLPGVLRGFQRDVAVSGESRGEEITLLRRSRLDLASGTMLKTWTLIDAAGQRRCHESAVRLYMPHRLVELLEAVGFVDITLYGDVHGAPLELDSPRCIAVARRPEEAP